MELTPQQQAAQAARKMVEVRKRIGYIEKKGYNEGQGYAFAQAADFYDKAREAMDEVGLATSVESELVHVETYQATNKKGIVQTWQRTIVRLVMTFIDIETGFVAARASALGCGADNGDKAIPKAQTGAEKYILATTFIVSTGDDPEASRQVDEAQVPDAAPAQEATSAGTSSPAAASEAAPKGKRPTKSQTTLSSLLERLAALDMHDEAAVNQFRLDGTAERKNLKDADWAQLREALKARMAAEGPKDVAG